MKDAYPLVDGLTGAHLIPAADQPDYTQVGHPLVGDNTNVGDLLADLHVRAGRGSAIAALHAESGRSLTFSALADQSTRLASALVRRGLKCGDRIAYKSPNVPEVLIVMLAIWKAGGVVTPIPVNARAADLEHLLSDTNPRFLFVNTAPDGLDELEKGLQESSVEEVFGFGPESESLPFTCSAELAATDPAALPRISSDQVAIIWHTGGTTGRPKSCYHTHRRFLLGGFMFGDATGSSDGQRWAAAAPIGHALGIIYYTIFSLLHGATAVFIERFNDCHNVLKAIAKHRITTMTALMPTWAKMAEIVEVGDVRVLTSLRRCYAMWQSASSSAVFDFWRRHNVELLNNFGSTSFATWVLIPRPNEPVPRAALGKPILGYQVEAVTIIEGRVRVLPRGEIGRMAVRGPTGLTYWKLPNLQRRDVVDGWTLCDDLIRFDDSGNAYYLGRSDYMISTAGFKVAPVEVEEVLARHPAVAEIAVVPAPCPIRQEIVTAFIKLREGVVADAALETAMREMVAKELSSYKAPRQFHFIDALPRDAVGKVQTKIVKQWANDFAAQRDPQADVG